MYSHRLSRLASLGVWVWWEIMPEPYVDPRAARSCAELFSLYSAPYRPTMSPALCTTMQMCDNSVQFYNSEEALIRRLGAPDNPCERMRDALDRIKGTHGRTLLDRIGSCHVALSTLTLKVLEPWTFHYLTDPRRQSPTYSSERRCGRR